MARYFFQQAAGGVVVVYDADERDQGRIGYIEAIPAALARTRYGYTGVDNSTTPPPPPPPPPIVVAAAAVVNEPIRTFPGYTYRPISPGGDAIYVYRDDGSHVAPTGSSNLFIAAYGSLAEARAKLIPPILAGRAVQNEIKQSINELGRFDYGRLSKYPHLSKTDITVWEKFIAAYPSAYRWADYDETVGQGRIAA